MTNISSVKCAIIFYQRMFLHVRKPCDGHLLLVSLCVTLAFLWEEGIWRKDLSLLFSSCSVSLRCVRFTAQTTRGCCLSPSLTEMNRDVPPPTVSDVASLDLKWIYTGIQANWNSSWLKRFERLQSWNRLGQGSGRVSGHRVNRFSPRRSKIEELSPPKTIHFFPNLLDP